MNDETRERGVIKVSLLKENFVYVYVYVDLSL